MALLDTVLIFIILSFLILLVWSKVMHQTMIETLYQIKEFIQSFKKVPEQDDFP